MMLAGYPLSYWVVGVIVVALLALYKWRNRFVCIGWPIMVPSSELMMIAPHATLTEAQVAALRSAAKGGDADGVLSYKDGWLELSIDRSAVPRQFRRERLKVIPYPQKPGDASEEAPAPAPPPEKTLRFVARKSVEIGPVRGAPVEIDTKPHKFLGINYAATVRIDDAIVRLPGRGSYDPGAPADDEAVNDEETDLLVAHACALVAVLARGGGKDALEAVSHVVEAAVKEFGGRTYLHAFLRDQCARLSPSPNYATFLFARLPRERPSMIAFGHTRSYLSWVERGYFLRYPHLSPPLPYFACAYDLGLKSLHYDNPTPYKKHDPTDPAVLSEQKFWWSAY